MNFYKLIKLNQYIKNHRVKFFGIWLFSLLNKRYLSVQFDPVLACNFKCKMCYFTDKEALKILKGIVKSSELELIANRVFNNALVLQIGCGAEPTLYKHNLEIMKLAKEKGVPHIKMVTNGNLLTHQDIKKYSESGLNEIILSLHGVYKESYEHFMSRGDYEKFHEVLLNITEQKKKNPNFKLRINYTFNEDNFNELKDFFEIFGKYSIDTIQLRPIDKIGDTEYKNYNLKNIENNYKGVLKLFKTEAENRKIILLAPESIERNNDLTNVVKSNQNDNTYLLPYVNCYISPDFFWKKNYNYKSQSIEEWKSQNNWHLEVFKNIFKSKKTLKNIDRNILNYSVDLNTN